jgi:hypothetical protein
MGPIAELADRYFQVHRDMRLTTHNVKLKQNAAEVDRAVLHRVSEVSVTAFNELIARLTTHSLTRVEYLQQALRSRMRSWVFTRPPERLPRPLFGANSSVCDAGG